jgi:pimeloyl-ACP methyl ester carboxylesterase
MARTEPSRHFATIHHGRWGHRQVHYRRAGSGPAVLLLHQSPLSSRDMLGTIERWKGRFTCIAPDTPGYGLSDPFGVAQLEMADIAQAVVEFMDAIGIEKAAVYGFHTGAMIAAAVALAYPERVTCAVSNGYVVLTEQEREEIVAQYLPPLVPAWDGSHLAWLWSRLREQLIFFPWYRKGAADRLDFDIPPPEALQNAMLDFLRSGDHYRVGYRAAFTMRSDAALRAMQAPMLVTAASADVLSGHLPRIRHASPSVTVQKGGSFEETLDLCADFIARHRTKAPPAPAATAPIAGRLWQQMIDVPGGQLRAKRNDDAPGRVVVVQHDAAGSSDIVAPLAASFIGNRPVVAIDLPGHGESDDVLARGRVTVGAYAKALLQALDALGVEDFDFLGVWGGGLVGLELAVTQPKRVAHLALADFLYFPPKLQAELRKRYTPEIEPVWYGGHLLHAWHLMRDQSLFWPWYERTRKGIIRKPVHVDPAMVHARVTEVLKAPRKWRAAYQAHFSYPVKSRLAACRVPALLCAPEWDPNIDHTEAAHRDHPHVPFMRMPPEWSRWGPELLPFFGRPS